MSPSAPNTRELETVEHETGPNPIYSIIWMHGLGADGHDFEPIVPALALNATRPLRFVFPHAPMRPVTMNGGYAMRAWFDIVAAARDAPQDEKGIWESVAAVERLIAIEKARGIDDGNIALAGFSQGGAIALITAMTTEARLAGAIGLSTFLPIADEVAARQSDVNAGLEVFMAHGEQDPVVSFRFGRNSRRKLADMGARMTWREYPMEHNVIPEEVAEIRAFLDRILT